MSLSDTSPYDGGSVPEPSLEPLPFPLVQLSPEQLDHLGTVIDRWRNKHPLVGDSLIEVVREYMRYCSPAGGCDEGIALVAEYLMWFFPINDIPDDAERRSILNKVQSALQGQAIDNEPMQQATSHFRTRVLETFGAIETRRFFQFLDRMRMAFWWETETAGQTPEPALYQKHREHTIAAYPFIELFRLAERAQPPHDDWPALCALEKLCVEVIYLTNDIFSIKRDLRKRKHNLVIAVARENRITYETALSQVVDLLKRKISDFGDARERFLSTQSLDESTRRYVDYLATVLEGNRVSHVVLAQRYRGNG